MLEISETRFCTQAFATNCLLISIHQIRFLVTLVRDLQGLEETFLGNPRRGEFHQNEQHSAECESRNK